MSLLAPLILVGRDPALRLAASGVFLFGAFAGAIAPYFSLIAVETFGLGNRAFAALLVVSSVLSVASSVSAGILTDQRANRRTVALLSAGLLFLGSAAVFLFPTLPIFLVAHAILLPAGSAIMGQFFALARLAATESAPVERDAILAAIRAIFALPFLIVLPLVSWAIRQGAPIMSIYTLLFAITLCLVALTAAFWPRDGRTGWQDRPSGLSFRAALAEIAHLRVSVRVVLIGAVTGASALYMVLMGLIFTQSAGRDAGDVALYAGLMAGLEVPFMLATPLMFRRYSKTALIAAGAAVYAVHLSGLALLAATPWVWLLIIPGAAGGAVILSLPIAYLQDLMADRPGTGSSLMAVQRIAADGFCAAAFVIGAALSGYGLAAIAGSAIAVGAALILVAIDARGAAAIASRRTL